jgi:hypothetical protein
MTTEQTDINLYPKTRTERIAVLKAISDSSKTINIQNSDETRIVFDDERVKLLMDVLDPFDDWSYAWTASALPQMVEALEQGERDALSEEAGELADSLTDVYTVELMAWASRNIDAVDEALKDGATTIISAVTQAQYMAINDHLLKLADIVSEYVDGGDEE